MTSFQLTYRKVCSRNSERLSWSSKRDASPSSIGRCVRSMRRWTTLRDSNKTKLAARNRRWVRVEGNICVGTLQSDPLPGRSFQSFLRTSSHQDAFCTSTNQCVRRKIRALNCAGQRSYRWICDALDGLWPTRTSNSELPSSACTLINLWALHWLCTNDAWRVGGHQRSFRMQPWNPSPIREWLTMFASAKWSHKRRQNEGTRRSGHSATQSPACNDRPHRHKHSDGPSLIIENGVD